MRIGGERVGLEQVFAHYNMPLSPGLLNYPAMLMQFCQVICGMPPQTAGQGTMPGVDTATGQQAARRGNQSVHVKGSLEGGTGGGPTRHRGDWMQTPPCPSAAKGGIRRGRPGVKGLPAFGRQPQQENLPMKRSVFRAAPVAAAEVAVGLAIIVALFRRRQTIQVEELNALKN